MSDLEKLADLFQKEVSDGDVFGTVSYLDEAKRLKLLAGKLFYKAEKEVDRIKADRIKTATKMILQAAEMLKDV